MGGVPVNAITLKTGEMVPPFPPNRYIKGHKYIRLRWKLDNGKWVEALEHRVLNGVIVDGEVHHKNHNPKDNSIENLKVFKTRLEHCVEHRKIDHDRIVNYYKSGMSTVQIAKLIGKCNGTVGFILRARGVQMRYGKGKLPGNRRRQLNDSEAVRILKEENWNISRASNRLNYTWYLTNRVALEHKHLWQK